MKPASKPRQTAGAKNAKPPTQFKEFSLSHQKPRKGKRLLDKLLKDNELSKPVKSTKNSKAPIKTASKGPSSSKNLLRLKSPAARNSLQLVSPVGKLVSGLNSINKYV